MQVPLGAHRGLVGKCGHASPRAKLAQPQAQQARSTVATLVRLLASRGQRAWRATVTVALRGDSEESFKLGLRGKLGCLDCANFKQCAWHALRRASLDLALPLTSGTFGSCFGAFVSLNKVRPSSALSSTGALKCCSLQVCEL